MLGLYAPAPVGGRSGATALVGSVMSMSVVPFFPRTIPLTVGTRQIQRAALAAGHECVALLEPPVDTRSDRPEVDGSAFRAGHGIRPDEVLAVAVCRLVPQLKREGLVSACTAVGTLAAEGAPVRLLIAGDGPCRPELEGCARDANRMAGRTAVTLVGALDDPQPAYAAADVVVGQGGSALRGMAFGKPLVVVGEEGFSEAASPATMPLFLENGFYGLGPGSAGSGPDGLATHLRGLVADAALRAELGTLMRQFAVDRFSVEHAAQTVESTYEVALGRGSHRRRVHLDLARSLAGVAGHKVVRRVRSLVGSVATDDANARPVRQPAAVS
jgi:glycosyltransferase involved in cell wall biosynthesis